MRILTIDPGNTKSAWLFYDSDGGLLQFGIDENQAVRQVLMNTDRFMEYEHLVIEMIASYGMPVGKSVFETCVWIGRFQECAMSPVHLMYRSKVKMHLCNSMRAKDSNIRQALLDRYPATGGGKTPQIGTKGKRGPLYGVSKDIWAALAVAVTWMDQEGSCL